MEYVDALYELKRSKRKCNEVNNGLEDFKRLLNDKDDRDSHYQEFLGFIWDNAERESDDKRKRDDYDEENDPTHEDQPVKRNKRLEIKIKVEGQKAGTSNPVPEKPCERVQLGVKGKTHSQKKRDDYDEENDPTHEDQPVKRNKRLEIKIKVEGQKAGTSNPVEMSEQESGGSNSVSEIMSERSSPTQQDLKAKRKKPNKFKGVKEDQPVEKNKTLEIQIKVEGSKAGTGNPVSKLGVKAETQQKMKFARVIQIDDDDEDSNIPSDQPRPKDKGGSVISENPEVEILDDYTFFKHGIVSPFVSSKKYHENVLDDDAENAVFRNDVLKVLRKPFDVEEYDRLKEAMKAGSYLDRHEDVNTVLQSRCKPEKQLAILRGFFFWLQNLTRKGAFRPWIDRVCLEVVPAHEDEN